MRSSSSPAPAPFWTLIAAIAGSSMSFIDGSAVNVALPVLQRDLDASAAGVQWVVEGYSVFLSALILIGGSLGDIFGRRLVFGLGIGIFALASIACALAPGIGVLIAARCVQGVGGALAMPGSLALIGAAYAGAARGKAIGTWSGFSAVTSALGPLVGGWLVQAGSWRLVFLINVPLALAVIAILVRSVPETRDETASRVVDVAGASLATAGLGALVYGLIRLGGAGAGDVASALAIVAGSCSLVAFVFVERRAKHPMIRLDLFSSRTFAIANLYTFALYATLGGSLYFVPFDLIDVQGYSPAAAGAALLPFVAIVFPLSRLSGGLVARVGPRIPLAAGAVLAAAGYAVFALCGIGHPYWTTFFPGAVLLGLGGAAFVAPLTTTVMDSVETSHAGAASGINNATSRTAGLVAIALFGIVLAHAFSLSLRADIDAAHLASASRAALSGGDAAMVAGRPPPGIAPADRETVERVVRSAFARGFSATMFASSFVATLAALVAFFGFSAGIPSRTFERIDSSR